MALWSCPLESVVTLNQSFWTGKRVLVLGHTGFKGAWLSLWLSRLGAHVFGLSLPAATDPNLFRDAALESLVDTEYCDIRDLQAVQRAMARTGQRSSFTWLPSRWFVHPIASRSRPMRPT